MLSILAVDDSPSMRKMVSFTLTGAGYQVVEAVDGQDALEKAQDTADLPEASGDAIAREFGYDVTTKRITRDDIYLADEAFFTGTAAEVTPIRELDDRKIGEGKRGPLTEKIQARFFDVVNGRAPEYDQWLAYV